VLPSGLKAPNINRKEKTIMIPAKIYRIVLAAFIPQSPSIKPCDLIHNYYYHNGQNSKYPYIIYLLLNHNTDDLLLRK